MLGYVNTLRDLGAPDATGAGDTPAHSELITQWSTSIELTDDNGDVEHRIGHIVGYTVAHESMARCFSVR
ncbi:hypothetical protein GCM10018963_54530 [Saccharothrix longispora]